MKNQIIILTLMIVLAYTSLAGAYTITDSYWGSNNHGYGDVIGHVDQYGIDRMEVTFDSGFMNVKIYTPFYAGIDAYGTTYGDLFISTNGWSPYGNASDMYKYDNASNGEVWEYVFDTSEGKLYGGFLNNDSFTLSQNAPPESLTPGTQYIVRDGQEVWYDYGGTLYEGAGSFSDEFKGIFLEYSISLASLGSITGDIGLKWGMTCANDSIEGSVPAPVPEPATMMLLGSGLVGLALYRRRMKK